MCVCVCVCVRVGWRSSLTDGFEISVLLGGSFCVRVSGFFITELDLLHWFEANLKKNVSSKKENQHLVLSCITCIRCYNYMELIIDENFSRTNIIRFKIVLRLLIFLIRIFSNEYFYLIRYTLKHVRYTLKPVTPRRSNAGISKILFVYSLIIL